MPATARPRVAPRPVTAIARAVRAVGGRLIDFLVRVRPRTWGIVAGVLAVVVAFGLWFRDSSFVDVTRVEITGVSGLQSRQISEALRTKALDMTTLHVDEGALRGAVSSFPLVTGISVSTHFPHGLTIEVRENVPVAAILAAGARTAVTADGRLLHSAPGTAGLPAIALTTPPAGGRVTAPRALEALRVLAVAPSALAAKVMRVTSTTAHGLVVQFRRGPVAYFGGTEALAAKWAALARVLSDSGAAGATYVDVTVPSHPAAGGVAGAPASQSDVPQLGGTPNVAGASQAPTATTPSTSTTQP
ncbi:MAG: FtsQ-type protein [Solirubrobacterales bacterium]|nr:FtsQ-type protein [Solirubrobacterales bacterium]